MKTKQTLHDSAAAHFPQILRDLRKEFLLLLGRRPATQIAREIGIGRNTLHAWLMNPESGTLRTVCAIAQWMAQQVP